MTGETSRKFIAIGSVSSLLVALALVVSANLPALAQSGAGANWQCLQSKACGTSNGGSSCVIGFDPGADSGAGAQVYLCCAGSGAQPWQCWYKGQNTGGCEIIGPGKPGTQAVPDTCKCQVSKNDCGTVKCPAPDDIHETAGLFIKKCNPAN